MISRCKSYLEIVVVPSTSRLIINADRSPGTAQNQIKSAADSVLEAVSAKNTGSRLSITFSKGFRWRSIPRNEHAENADF
jgi:hypothetical protein